MRQCLCYLIAHVMMSLLMTIGLIKVLFFFSGLCSSKFFQWKGEFCVKSYSSSYWIMAPLILYHSPVSPFSRSVHLLIRYLKIDADITVLDLQEKKEQMTPEFLEINPQHCVRFFWGIFIRQGVITFYLKKLKNFKKRAGRVSLVFGLGFEPTEIIIVNFCQFYTVILLNF